MKAQQPPVWPKWVTVSGMEERAKVTQYFVPSKLNNAFLPLVPSLPDDSVTFRSLIDDLTVSLRSRYQFLIRLM